MFAFLLLLFVLLVIYSFTAATKEGFNPMNTSPLHEVNIPVNKIPSMLPSPPASMVQESCAMRSSSMVLNKVSTLPQNGSIFSNCSVKPSTLPGQLPHAPYEQIAVASPLPYQDTTLIKANRQQLINLLELLKGFLAFEAQEIAERSDPTIQLPLQTARSDFHTLQSEVEVLNRNPGIQPNMTLSHLNEISSNLAFLQREVRLIGTAGPIQGPIYQFTKPVEGFIAASAITNAKAAAAAARGDGPAASKAAYQSVMDAAAIDEAKRIIASSSTPENDISTSNLNADFEAQRVGMSMSSVPMMTYAPAPGLLLSQETPQPRQRAGYIASSNEAAPSIIPNKSAKSSPASIQQDTLSTDGNATVEDLKDFIDRVRSASIELSASGTTNLITRARVDGLGKMIGDITTILDKIQNGTISESEIPVKKSELVNVLRIVSDPSDPLHQLIKETGLPPGLANLLPPNIQKDPEITREINHLIDKYMDTIVNGVSASFEVKYTSPFEAMKGYGAMMNQSTIDTTGFPSMSDLNNISNAQFTPMDSGMPVTDPMAPTPSDAGRGPSRFDWKERSKQIEQQVKKRGLKACDYGIMPPQTKVSEGFSWKGYARMMCTRLQADTDPSLPVTCGCPPLDWPGWRIAK